MNKRTYAITTTCTVGLGALRPDIFAVKARTLRGAVRKAEAYINEHYYAEIGSRIVSVVEWPVDAIAVGRVPNEVRNPKVATWKGDA